MTKRRRILYADKIIQNAIHLFCLLMFLQLRGYYSLPSNPILLYSTTSDIRVSNTSRISKVNTVVNSLEQGAAVDFLHRKQLICWSDQTAELIQCMNYNDTHIGEKVTIVSDGLITPTGIAIDWYTEKIYWADGETNRIEVIGIEQKHRKVLFWSEVDLARAIAVVPDKGAGMNGDPTTRRIIVKEDIYWPNGITVDYDTDVIYWVDAKLCFIDAVDFNGGKRKRIVKSGLACPLGLLHSISNYNKPLNRISKAIHTWDMTTHGPVKDLLKQANVVPVDVKVYSGSRQQMPDGDYPCRKNNGMCSHLSQSMLVVAQRATISKISLDSSDFTPYTLPLKDLKRAVTVDFDPVTEYIYWADNLAKTISKARLDGSEQSVVIHSNGVPDSIAIDPLARNIYWTDPNIDTINVARLDGSSEKILIHSDLYDPRAIALHPKAGWMFWSDWNEKRPKIERSNLDGSNRVVLISEKLAWPNGIALDVLYNKLCVTWTVRIERNYRVLKYFIYLDSLCSETTCSERQQVVEQMANMMGVKAFRIGEPLGWNRCADTNGGCSHLCFNRPEDYTCGCPLGKLQHDGREGIPYRRAVGVESVRGHQRRLFSSVLQPARGLHLWMSLG
ncbi:Low-density lipoprotein receptor-related protein 6 [Operophtera brumata]|uniref:Low-density lipoprotein receptor-related protein 6 n=1 Tax=Operophtera brumata TaxID=104452 RepID=A0A0L7LIC0_OPEBR|nr:Low-density lipoprotein receptor-related protein 6 [Operophtera brumata]